jgi:RNA polymerase sigma-70 factor, ECF subfamily
VARRRGVREPEPETIVRARGGDLRAFEELVLAYQADVWRFAYHLTHSRATADDISQETFIRAWRAVHTFRGDTKFTNWLLRITRNCAVDSYRRTRRETPTDEVRQPTGSPRASTEERLRLQAAIRALPMHLREPFVVIEVLGFDYREASAILGVKNGTLKSRMFRARAALIHALGEEAAGEG